MAEILYRNDEHRFSVYRLSDIPDGVPCSGWASLDCWRSSRRTSRPVCHYNGGDRARWVASLSERDAFAAVLDEHAGPLLAAPRFTVGMRAVSTAYGSGTVTSIFSLDLGVLGVRLDGDDQPGGYHPSAWEPEPRSQSLTIKRISMRVAIPTVDIHREKTKRLGAQHGERPHPTRGRTYDPDAWSAHLRYLVSQSADRDAARAPSVGWDPYGDDE